MTMVRKEVGEGVYIEYDQDEYDRWIKTGAKAEESPIRQWFGSQRRGRK